MLFRSSEPTPAARAPHSKPVGCALISHRRPTQLPQTPTSSTSYHLSHACPNPRRNHPTPTRVKYPEQPKEHHHERHPRLGHRHPDPDHHHSVFRRRVLKGAIPPFHNITPPPPHFSPDCPPPSFQDISLSGSIKMAFILFLVGGIAGVMAMLTSIIAFDASFLEIGRAHV